MIILSIFCNAIDILNPRIDPHVSIPYHKTAEHDLEKALVRYMYFYVDI